MGPYRQCSVWVSDALTGSHHLKLKWADVLSRWILAISWKLSCAGALRHLCPVASASLSMLTEFWKELSQHNRSKKQEAEAARLPKGYAYNWLILTSVFYSLEQSQDPLRFKGVGEINP